MVQLTTEQRAFVVLKYQETKSYVAVQNAFGIRFPGRRPPCKRTIQKNVEKYQNHGTSLNRNKNNSGRRRTTRTPHNINMVQNHLQNHPTMSMRRNNLAISRPSLNRIIRQELQWHPYKIHKRHQLKRQDFPRRMAFCRWFLNANHNPRFSSRIIIGDEAAFHMNGKVTSNNVRMYAPRGQRPDFNYDVNFSREKISVWAGICGNGSILGPFFFDRNVSGPSYLAMLNRDILPSIPNLYPHIQNPLQQVWWFQDGAPAHRSRAVKDRLVGVFDQRLVALGTRVEWPPRSPDLTPMDFFLWGHIKSKIFVTPPQNIAELRQRINQAINNLRGNRNFVLNAVRKMARRAGACVANGGQHVE